MGIFSSCQFLGAFVGGALGGAIANYWGEEQVFLVSAGLLMVWYMFALGMKPIVKSKSLSFNLQLSNEDEAKKLADKLAKMPGVIESTIVFSDSVAYVKIDDKTIDMEKLKGDFNLNFIAT